MGVVMGELCLRRGYGCGGYRRLAQGHQPGLVGNGTNIVKVNVTMGSDSTLVFI